MKRITQVLAMNRLLLLFFIAALAFIVSRSAAQENALTLEQLRTNYQTMRELETAPLTELQGKYRTQLATLQEKAKAAGDLDAVLIIQAEEESFPLETTKLPPKASRELIELQRFYIQYRNRINGELTKKLAAIDARYLAQLEALEKSLTKEGKIEEAVKARQAVEEIRKNPPAVPSASPPSKIGSGGISIQKGLIAHWEFDDDFEDRKGKFNGSTQGPTKMTFADGKFGRAAFFTQDSNIKVPHSPGLNLNHPFTIALWIKIGNSEGKPGFARGVISKTHDSWSMQFGPTSNPEFSFRVVGAKQTLTATVPAQRFREDVWTHIAGTFDGQKVTVFINGRDEGRDSTKEPFWPQIQEREVRMGSNFTHYFWWFYGLMDDVRIYERVLSDEEIGALAKSE